MKKLFCLVVMVVCVAQANAQHAGVGTSLPDSSSILDIASDSLGVLIPRLADTTKVNKAIEGLIIYNKNKKAPFYNDGNKWLSLGSRGPAQAGVHTDSITYQITGNGFDQTEILCYSASVGQNNPVGGVPPMPGQPNFSDYSIIKVFDTNSKNLNLAVLKGTLITSIEFKYYGGGSVTPYASHRFKNVYLTSFQMSIASGGAGGAELVSFIFANYGFKDWVNGVEFGFDVTTQTESTY